MPYFTDENTLRFDGQVQEGEKMDTNNCLQNMTKELFPSRTNGKCNTISI